VAFFTESFPNPSEARKDENVDSKQGLAPAKQIDRTVANGKTNASESSSPPRNMRYAFATSLWRERRLGAQEGVQRLEAMGVRIEIPEVIEGVVSGLWPERSRHILDATPSVEPKMDIDWWETAKVRGARRQAMEDNAGDSSFKFGHRWHRWAQ
jgi:hypothetical protein